MDRKTIGALLMLVLAAGIVVVYIQNANVPVKNPQTATGSGGRITTAVPTNPTIGTNTTTTHTQSGSIPFNQSQYFQSAYLVDSNSGDAQVALQNVNITTKTLSNGSVEYSFVFLETNAIYNITIANGEKLYFIDTNLADDGTRDTSVGDEGYAIVSASGYIISVQYPLPFA
ncbi:MAG: hypothetical protein KGH67_06045 [Candidatus Micrarchaeota archaeon]|nr:hypothetical protein [Candidatus Micrarchaeota archaeon]